MKQRTLGTRHAPPGIYLQAFYPPESPPTVLPTSLQYTPLALSELLPL